MIPDNPSPESVLPEVDPLPAAPSADAELPPTPAAPTPAAPARWPDKPWLTIWVAPRKTMRAILDANPRRYVILLAALVGTREGYTFASNGKWGESIGVPFALLLALLVGAVLGLASLYIMGAIYRWTGSLVGGVVKSGEVRAAIAWASIPVVASLALLLLELLIFRGEPFLTATPRMDANSFAVLILAALQLALAAWTWFLTVKTVSEAHRINAWRGLCAVALPMIILFVLIFGCNLLSQAFYFGP